MKLFRKIISIAVTVSFLAANITFADTNTFKLAVPSRISDTEFKEKAQIRINIMKALKSLDMLTPEALIGLGEVPFAEDTVLGTPITGTIYFNMAGEATLHGVTADKDCLMFATRVDGKKDKIYYCLVSKNRVNGEHLISMVSQEVMEGKEKTAEVTFTHGTISKEERDIINLYTSHEISTENNEAIDPWIRARMKQGTYMVMGAGDNTLYDNAQKKLEYGYFNSVYQRLLDFISYMDIKKRDQIIAPVLKLPIVIIPYTDQNDLPKWRIGNESVFVMAHSSAFATYIFMPEAFYRGILSEQAGYINHGIYSIMPDLIHEVLGARCGLDVKCENGKARNVLDGYYHFYAEHDQPSSMPTSEVQRMNAEGVDKLVRTLEPKNLLNLELRNDYAAGEVNDGTKKNIFMRVLTPLITVALLAIGGKIGYEQYFSDDGQGRIAGVELVNRMPGPVGVKLLIRTLNDRIGNIRWEAIKALAKKGAAAEPALPRLRVLAENDRENYVREEAKRAIGIIEADFKMNGGEHLKDTDWLVKMRKNAIEDLAKNGNPFAVDILIDALSDTMAEVRRAAIFALSEKGQAAEKALRELDIVKVRDRERYIRKDAVKAIDRINKAIGNDVFAIALAGTGVKHELGVYLYDETGNGTIIETYADKEAFLKGNYLAQSFGDLEKDISSKARRTQAINENRHELAAGTVVKFTITHNPEGRTIEKYKDFDAYAGNERPAEVKALQELPQQAKPAQPVTKTSAEAEQKPAENVTQGSVKLSEKINDMSMPEIIELVKSKDWAVRQAARNALVKSGNKAIPHIAKAIKGLDASSRETGSFVLNLVLILGEIGEAEGVPVILEASQLKGMAAWMFDLYAEHMSYGNVTDAILRIGKGSMPYLINCFKGNNGSLKFIAIQVMRDLGPEAKEGAPYIRAWLSDKNASAVVKTFAPSALARIEGKEAVKFLLGLVNDDEQHFTVRVGSVRALGEIGKDAGEAVPVLEKHSADKESFLYESAKKALENINKPVEPGAAKDKTSQTGSPDDRDLVQEVNDTAEQMAEDMVKRLWDREKINIGDPALNDELNGTALAVLAGLGLVAFPAPENKADIRAIVSRIKDPEIEVFMPSSILDNDVLHDIKDDLEAIFGNRLRTYGSIDDLLGMKINKPGKAIVMTANLTGAHEGIMDKIIGWHTGIRFMNFKGVDVKSLKKEELYIDYIKETLVKLLVARVITPEEADQKDSPYYRMFAHLIAGDIGESRVDDYIRAITDIKNNVLFILKTILKLDMEELGRRLQAVKAVWQSA